MKKIFFTPGPSQLYPTVEKHLKYALEKQLFSISHRSVDFQNIYNETVSNIKKLFTVPKDHSVFFLSSATEAMERIIENGVEKKSFHLVNGAFSSKFFQISQDLKKQPEKFEVEAGKGFDVNSINITKNTEVICITHNETSTGVAVPVDDIYSLKKRHPDSFIGVDIVSSAPYVTIDAAKIDYLFFSVQKGFGMPSGLGVLIVSPIAMEKSIYLAKKGTNIGSYHNFLQLEKYALKSQTPMTPNVLGIYLLGKVSGDMLKKGLKTIRKETEEKAGMVYRLAENHELLSPFVADKNNRSKTVIVINVKGGSEVLIKKLKEKGIVVGKGYKQFKEEHIRIANFPTHSTSQMAKLVKLLF